MAVTLPHIRWMSLAQDMAILSAPGTPFADVSQVLSSYGMTTEEFGELLQVPLFQDYYRAALAEIRAQGGKAGAIYRAGALARGVSEKLYNDFIDGGMETKEAVKFLELLYRASGLMEKQGASVAVQVNNHTAVVPSPAGLNNPKFEHLRQPAVLEAAGGA